MTFNHTVPSSKTDLTGSNQQTPSSRVPSKSFWASDRFVPKGFWGSHFVVLGASGFSGPSQRGNGWEFVALIVGTTATTSEAASETPTETASTGGGVQVPGGFVFLLQLGMLWYQFGTRILLALLSLTLSE